MAASTTLSPSEKHQRAKNAALARTQPEYLAQKLVSSWPELSASQKHAVRTLLRPVVGRGGS